MKKIILIVGIFGFFSCKNIPEQIIVPIKQYDSLVRINETYKEDINKLNKKVISFNCDSITKKEEKKLKDTVFILNFKIQKCLYYADIVKNNPSQIVFFRGWINRATK